MNLTTLFLTFFFAVLVTSTISAQNKKLDSLYVVLQNHTEEDTNRVLTLTRACYYEYTSKPENCRKHAEEARALAEKIGYKKGVGLSLRYTSLYHWVTGNYEQAADFAFQMLKVFEDLGDESGMAKAYTLIGLIHDEWDNFDKSKEYHLKSLELNQKANRLYDVAYNYNSLGALHDGSEKQDEAYDYYLRSLEIRKQINDEDGMSQSYVNLGGIAHDRQQYDKAREYYALALPIARKLGNINRLSLISQALGRLYSEKGEFEKANTLLMDALTMSQRLGNKRVERGIYRSLLSLERERGNYKKALEYAMNEMAVQDSAFTEEKTRQMAEMEASYETAKKEQAIELLARDNKIKELWQNIFGGSLAAILLAGFVYYRFQQSNARKNKELLEVQESVNKKLTEVDKMKSQFFASVSHEFRTPLTLIKGPIEQYLECPDEHLTLENAQMIHRNSNRLLQLVNQLLDLSKIDSGNLKIENEDGDVYKFLRMITSSFDSYALQHGINYSIKFDSASLVRSFDHDKLEKVAYNLLSNAFKFTPANGNVTFTCWNSDQKLIIQVSDSGKGIGPEHIGHVFDRFYQGDGHHNYEGTGIGLSLVKELVAVMGGSVEVKSEVGRGSVFSVVLALSQGQGSLTESTENTEEDGEDGSLTESTENTEEDGEDGSLTESTENTEEDDEDGAIVKAAADNNAADNRAAFDNRSTVLVVEDNGDMRSFIREQLEDVYGVVEAINGKQGLEMARRDIPDLIISDVMMPEMDGIAMCEAVKKDEHTSHIPVILLTAKGGNESKVEGLGTGADDYLTKPFYTQELLARVRNLIVQRQQLRKIFSQQIVLQPKDITISSVDRIFLERVENAIESNLSQVEFAVPQLQDALSMSKTQLHRKMKALTDQAPGEFLRNYRLKRAAQLLEQNGGNVTEIAFAVGFGSLSYFTRSFKELFGQSPTEYSKHIKIPQ